MLQKLFPQNGENVPEIRFSNFTDTWEQRKLGSICKITMGQSPNGSTYSETPCDYILVQGNADLKDGWVVPRIWTSQITKTAKSGDLIMSVRAPAGAIGKTAYDVVIGRGVASINGNEFIYQTLKKYEIEGYWRKIATGSTFKSINSEDINDTILFVPIDDSEQKQIGSLFSKLDNLITLHQRQCENLKKLKKFMLQKLFPQNGENVPEIRFSNFTDTWEQRKLEEICESFEYGLNAAAKEYDGENKYIRITDIDDNSHEFIQDDVTSPDIDLTNSENYQLKYGDVIFTRTGASVGKTYIYKESDGLVYYAGFLIRGRVKSNYSPEFIFQNTLTDDYDKFIRITSQRSGQPGVNAQEYASYEISVPKFEEQQKIGAYFSTLDHLITLHQSKCDKLIEVKKYMLQNMFI